MRGAWMTVRKDLPATVLGVLLIVCLVAYYSTRESGTSSGSRSAENGQLVDSSLLRSAISLAALAATPDEQAQAREAWTLADHELDLRFAAAIRDAEAEASTPATGPLLELSNQIKQLQARVDADKMRVGDLAKDTTGALDRAQAQLDLDQDELDDAKGDFARQSGDKQGRLQRLLQEHEASDKIADQTMKYGSLGSAQTMNEQVREWFSLADYNRQLQAAAQQAATQSQILLQQHNTLQSQFSGKPDDSASVDRLRLLAEQQKTIRGLDQRVVDTKQLAAAYQDWSGLVVHLIQGSLAAVLGVLLAAVVLNIAVRSALRRGPRRRVHQVQLITRIALQILALLL